MTDHSRWNKHEIWKHYTSQCDKYDMQRLTAVHDIVHGHTTHFQMRNYCPQTIGICLAFETFAAHQLICIVTHIDACNSPFSESACQTLNDLMVTSRRLQYLNLANCWYEFRLYKVRLDRAALFRRCNQYIQDQIFSFLF